MEHVAGRLEPSQIPPDGNFRGTWFKYKGSFSNGGSFPSGHAASAFAVAAVIADQYRHRRWVPWLCYGTATFLSLTRLPAQAHLLLIVAVLAYPAPVPEPPRPLIVPVGL